MIRVAVPKFSMIIVVFLVLCLLCTLAPSTAWLQSPPLRLPTFLHNSPLEGPGISPPLNVLGSDLKCCCADVRGTGIGTGFYRDGHCSTGPDDTGKHTVCIVATSEFLQFSKSVGNDLSTPIPEYNFPGVNPGDKWCLCALRWVQAFQAGCAPKLCLLATHAKTLDVVTNETRDFLLRALKEHAVDGKEAEEIEKELNERRESLEKMMRGDTEFN